jgi:large subunit ribosomal protein L18
MENKKELQRAKRHKRFTLKIKGSPERPRLVIRRSLKNLFAQVVDDQEGRIIFSLSTLNKEIRQKFPCSGNISAASFMGEVFSRRLKEKGVTRIIFDRGGYLYHGRVKAFAEGLRKSGLEF